MAAEFRLSRERYFRTVCCKLIGREECGWRYELASLVARRWEVANHGSGCFEGSTGRSVCSNGIRENRGPLSAEDRVEAV